MDFVVTASSEENSDLYWAMRAAGPCFGVATSIIFQEHATPQVWHGDLVFPSSAIPAIVEFDTRALKASKGESSAVMIFGVLPMSADPIVLVSVFHNGPEKEAREVFAPLLKLGPIDEDEDILSDHYEQRAVFPSSLWDMVRGFDHGADGCGICGGVIRRLPRLCPEGARCQIVGTFARKTSFIWEITPFSD